MRVDAFRSDPSQSIDVLRASIDGLCVPGVLAAFVQPIVRLSDMAVVGYEALARVAASPPNAPDWWLDRAQELNMRARLEVACWRTIIEIGSPPDDCLLFLNISPATLADPELLALRDHLPERTVIEVTEQEAVADYEQLREDLRPWVAKDFRLAIDDAGAGHSSLRHVIELEPDFIKIDRSLIQGIDTDRNRRALVHSLIAFAREVGITVIAEGIETHTELEILRDAEVTLGQGYLFAKPARPWPRLAFRNDHTDQASTKLATSERSDKHHREQARLRDQLVKAEDAKAACNAVVEFLYRRGQLMPSVYLELEGQLRCIAQRGLWHVLDGMLGSSGITGRTWASGEPMVVADVRNSAEYLEAIPGVISEICVPIISEGETIGALNVESITHMADDTFDVLQDCVGLLVERLRVVGWRGGDHPWRRVARASKRVSDLPLERLTPTTVIEILRDASGMDSVCLMQLIDGETQVVAANGPLGSILTALPGDEIADLAKLVATVNSCYTADNALGRGFVGSDSIRAFARAVIVLPLRSGGIRIGTIVLANSRPRALSSEDVEPLELIAGQLGATLDAAALVERLQPTRISN